MFPGIAHGRGDDRLQHALLRGSEPHGNRSSPPIVGVGSILDRIAQARGPHTGGWYKEEHGITGGKLDGHNIWIPDHEPRNKLHLWALQPPVADAALKELLKARHKWTDSFHVVLIPRLMTPWWQGLFNKACDFTFVVSPGSSSWPSNMFKPLWIGIVLPFTHHRPWCFKRALLLVKLGGTLRGLLETCEEDAGNLLGKLLKLLGRVASLLQRVACGVLHVPWSDTNIPHAVN